jgi:SAM-dependent methyltransferase
MPGVIQPMRTPVARQNHHRASPGRLEGLVHFAEALAWRFRDAQGWRVLDVGGADGRLAEALFQVSRGHFWWDTYYYVDPFPAPAACGEVALGTVVAVGEALPFAARSFDLVVSKQTLPHLLDPLACLAEMQRVARTAIVIRQDWGHKTALGAYQPIGWPGHSRSHIDHPDDILAALQRNGWVADYDDTDFVARRREA